MPIRFGTSGWRGILGEDFVLPKVALAVQAICDVLKATRPSGEVLVAGDSRFLSERLMREACEILAGNGFTAIRLEGFTPTPVVCHELIQRRALGAINFTASHNPANFHGLKFSPSTGAAAPLELTRRIERRFAELESSQANVLRLNILRGLKEKRILEMDPKPAYLRRLRKTLNISAIRKSKIRVGADLFFGCARGYLDELLTSAGALALRLNDERDVLFGGRSSDPAEENLARLSQEVRGRRLALGIACDGDADRFGIIDSDGRFISPGAFLGILLDHLARTRKLPAGAVVARSVMTSHFVDAVAKRHGLSIIETPVGFKHIAEVFFTKPLALGGEESGGLTILGHLPEKDGILACGLACEVVAMARLPLRKILSRLMAQVGSFYTVRLNLSLSREIALRLRERLTEKLVTRLDGMAVERIVEMDGTKFILKGGGWLGLRFSGTEPVVRLYAEAESPEKLKALVKAGKGLVNDREIER